jgi:hypothetical protein
MLARTTELADLQVNSRRGEPSGGLEPPTPSLPWKFGSVTRVHPGSLWTYFPLQIGPFEWPLMRRETSRVSFLMCPFCVCVSLLVWATPTRRALGRG